MIQINKISLKHKLLRTSGDFQTRQRTHKSRFLVFADESII